MEPPYDQWERLARGGAAAAAGWSFQVAGIDAGALRASTRTEALSAGHAFCSRLGITARPTGEAPELIVATGHQPELYHPGVWAKDFLLQRFADATGAAAVDVIVDSDGFASVGLRAPCMRPEPTVCGVDVAVGGPDDCFACTPAPSAAAIAGFRARGDQVLATLPVSGPLDAFGRFCEELEPSAALAGNLAEAVTLARRRYESPANTDYLEVPVTDLARSRGFAHFVAHIALDARAFATAYNAALASYRERTGTRSAAQPFPDLGIGPDAVELPLWTLGATRRTVWARTTGAPALTADGVVVCDLDADPALAVERLVSSGLALAPKALALTMFVRMFVADLFIHGVGGGRYDQVTDDVARRYFGVELPSFVVGSLTAHVPLGLSAVNEADTDELVMALNRLEHNPDQMLREAPPGLVPDPERATALADEKGALVRSIAAPGADKKAMGSRIREVNAELAALLEPVRRSLEERLGESKRAAAAAEVLADRAFSFCLWDARDVAAMVDEGLDSRASH